VVRKMVSREETSWLLVRFMGRMRGIVGVDFGFKRCHCLVFFGCCDLWCVGVVGVTVNIVKLLGHVVSSCSWRRSSTMWGF
jgi:hypothetical protein